MDAISTDSKTEAFDLDASIDGIARWLPSQSPIKDFIHHNTLHALLDQPFHEAVAIASQIYGANSYLPLKAYQTRFANGRIYDFALERVLKEAMGDEEFTPEISETLYQPDDRAHYPPPSLASGGIRRAWLEHIEINLESLTQPVLFRLVSNFLDQGIGLWTVARENESFWRCLRRLVEDTFVPLHPLDSPEIRAMVSNSPDQVILTCLQRIVGNPKFFGLYLLEMTLSHPGWSGMVRVIEKHRTQLLSPRIISLKEFIAVELLMELSILIRKKGHNFVRLSGTPGIDGVHDFASTLSAPPLPLKLRIWHEAMEWSVYAEALQAIKENPIKPELHPNVQAIFCIDDRECSVRRHLEEIDSKIETFGAAGFFGIEFFYKGQNEIYPVAQCPIVMKPRHLVIETSAQEPTAAINNSNPPHQKRQTSSPLRASGSMFSRWLFTHTLGIGYASKLAFEVFRPGARLVRIQKLGETEQKTRLHLFRESNTTTHDGRLLGFSREEMANRLETFFRNIGLADEWAPLILVVAHGSSSTNNPHFAAYDCGACAGKPGAPNARAFAQMANDPGVRNLLKSRGIVIPEDSHFVAGLHDTTRDEVRYFDLERLPEGLAIYFKRFKDTMLEALSRNAMERCRWFELGPRSPSPKKALHHVRTRASSIFEPRPELNHSNNAYCIVGRRPLTRSLFLDRRAFLHSYDPLEDAQGEILSQVLSQVIPVCGGINLEYFFSKIDNEVYGAGTKLPHNVIGLLGVANGVEGDLRTGLPSQMIEAHEPIRLLIMVEQHPRILKQSISKIASLQKWLDNEWVRLASICPETRACKIYRNGMFEAIEFPETFKTPRSPNSMAAWSGRTGTVRTHIVDSALH